MKTFIYGTVLLAGALAVADAATVTTLGGGPTPGNLSKTGARDGNTLLQAKFNQPHGIAVSADGSLIIADKRNRRLREVVLPGDTDLSFTTTFARKLGNPTAVATDAAGNVYAANERNGTVTVYDAAGVLQETYSGFGRLTAIAVDSGGTIYVANTGGAISWIAPDGTSDFLVGGFVRPSGLALFDDSTLVVSDSGAHAIYTVNTGSGEATLYTGGNGAGFADGPANVARFNAPWGIATGPGGTLVVADRLNHRVRLVSSSGAVSTIYGVSRQGWERPFAGWRDGAAAQGREPIGVAVSSNTVYVTEAYWHTVREVVGAFGVTTNNPPPTTNGPPTTNVVVGTNLISLGFTNGESSTDFVGAAGQTFFAPVTLTMPQGMGAYSFQFSISATNEGPTPLSPAGFYFSTMLMKKADDFFLPIHPNYTAINPFINQMSVGWLERFQFEELYPTKEQDLVTYSMAHNLLHSKPKPILGAFGFEIPASATVDETYLVTLSRPSGTTDGIETDLPVNVAFEGGLMGVRRVTLASRPYVVGDTQPFRWLNAGDFGDNYLVNNDVMQAFQTAARSINAPVERSDFFDAMDSSDGSTNSIFSGSDTLIDSIMFGDGMIAVDDIFVTFRRSLESNRKWYARYWSNGVRHAIEVPNVARPGGVVAAATVAPSAMTVGAKSITDPRAFVSGMDVVAQPGATIQIPVRAQISGSHPIRVMMIAVTVEPLDGSPAITQTIAFTPAQQFGVATLSDSTGANNVAKAWLDTSIAGVTDNAILGSVTMTLPATAGPLSAYRLHFNHFSASPNGLGLFQVQTMDTVITGSDRTGSTWGDGISDIWRLRHFGTLLDNESGATKDPDGDGVTNAVEFQNGSNPFDAASF